MFEKTQLKRVPTGFLLDYAVDLVDFDNYNGRFITDSNCVSISTFENALVSLQSADVTKRQLTDAQRELYYFRNEDKSNNINLGVLFYRYNYISEDALSANKIPPATFRKIPATGQWAGSGCTPPPMGKLKAHGPGQ